MKNYKLFLYIFIGFGFLQFLTGLANTLVFNSPLSVITSTLINMFSLPINLVRNDLPFYAREGNYWSILYWFGNLLVQTVIIYGLFRVFGKKKI